MFSVAATRCTSSSVGLVRQIHALAHIIDLRQLLLLSCGGKSSWLAFHPYIIIVSV